MAYGMALAALADPTRRRIFERVLTAPQPVGVIADGLPVSRPAVSQHLKVLKDAGLVLDNRAGTRRLYQLNPEGVARLRAHFDQMWTKALGNFQTAAEKPPIGAKHGKPSRTRSKSV